MIQFKGEIVDADGRYLTLRVPYTPEYVHQDMKDATVFLHDGREISGDQRRKAWALVGEIAAWSGYHPREKEDLNDQLKAEFLRKRADDMLMLAIGKFSLSDVEMTVASMYIQFLVDFVLENNVPTKQPIAELCEDIQQAVYSALIHRRCIVCGGRAELHHVDRIGMGNDRTKVQHIGRKALPLCRTHHQEIDHRGDAAFCKLYHVEPVEIDKKIARTYRLNMKEDK